MLINSKNFWGTIIVLGPTEKSSQPQSTQRFYLRIYVPILRTCILYSGI